MSTAYQLPVSDLGRMMREADLRVKDKSYRAFPIGQDVGRYLRAFRWRNEKSSADVYETVLARFAVRHSDMLLEEFASPVGTEYALIFLDHYWGECAPDTKARVLSILKSFFTWAVGEHRLTYNPLGHIKGPRRKKTERVAYPRDVILRLVSAQESLRDQCCVQLLARMGLRKNELRVLKVGEIDLARNLVTIHGKGGNLAVMPIEFKQLQDDLYLHLNGETRHKDEYLLYPKRHRTRPMSESGVHHWFKRCLERAALPETVKIHEMRHTAGDEIWRVTGDLMMAKELLRHEHVSTTERYLHPHRADLSRAMEAVDKAWEKE